MTELGGDVDSPSKNDTYTPKAHTRKKLIAQQRRYARVYKGIGETSVTFFGKGGARERADVFLHRKTEQSVLCSDVVPLAGVEPARYRYRRILSPLRLPIPSQRQR